MSAKVIATVLLLSTALSFAGAALTRRDEWFHTKNPFTVMIDSIFYTISSHDKYQLVISPSGDEGEQCVVNTRSPNESFTGRIKAAALYHKIVVWGKREQVDDGLVRRTNYTIALIEPKACTRYFISDLVDHVPSSYPNELPEVTVHQDSFDIFFPSQKGCFPCSYDLNGEPIEPREQLEHLGSPGAPFYLKEIDVTNNYVYLYNFDNGTAAIRLITSKFEDRFYPPRQLVVNATVNNLVVKQTVKEKSYAGINYVLQGSPRRPHFLLFKEDLEVVFSAHLPLLDNYSLVDSSIAIDIGGDSYVTLVQQSGKTRKITRVVYALNGRIISNLEIYELEPKVDYDVQSFVDGYEYYCLVVHDLSDKHDTKIKCRQG